jgi:HAD superfamily hydrolase (TIGR01509 family)
LFDRIGLFLFHEIAWRKPVAKYRAILFDLFGTVALLDTEKLPIFEWEGQMMRATTAALRTFYEQHVTNVSFFQFFTAMTAVAKELRDARAHELREVSCARRFLLTLLRTGLNDSPETRRLAEELARVHTTEIAKATEVPPAHVALLERARTKYSLALVSNFDHGPTARHILHAAGVRDHFHRIVISEEHGRCKPHPAIFGDTLMALGVAPEEALFVGDSPADDIAGAKRAGIDVVWVNAHDEPLPRGIPVPNHTIKAIPELQYFLSD